jgi:hypothetical protein
MAILARFLGSGTSTFPTTAWAAPSAPIFTATERNDGSAYSFNSSTSTVTLPSSDLADGYLLIARVHMETTHNNRHVQQGRFALVSGSGNFINGKAGSYSRNTSNNKNYVQNYLFVDAPAPGTELQYQWKRDTGDGTPAGSVVFAAMDVIPLYYDAIGAYTTTTPEALGGTTSNVARTLETTVVESDAGEISRSGNTVTIAGGNGAKYLVLGSVYSDGGTNNRTQVWTGPIVNGTLKRSAMANIYFRDSGTNDNGGIFHTLVVDPSASTTLALAGYQGDGVADNQGGADVPHTTPGAMLNTFVVLRLPDAAEVGEDTNSSSQSLAATTGTEISGVERELPEADVLLGGNISGAYSSVSSSTRYTGRVYAVFDGAEQPAIVHGNYGRGNQGGTDTFGFSANPIGYLTPSGSGKKATLEAQRTGDNGPVSAQAGWVGLWYVNLDSLVPTSLSVSPVGAAQAHTIGTTVLTQAHILAPAGVNHIPAVEEAALAQAHNLTPGDAAQAHTVAATTLTQAHNLTPAGAEHVHGPDTTTLSQTVTVSPAELLHGQAVDGPYNGTLYWAVYPSTEPDATAGQLIAGAGITGAIYADDALGLVYQNPYTRLPVTGLTPATEYKVSVVWSDGTEISNVDTTTFTTDSIPLLAVESVALVHTIDEPVLSVTYIFSPASLEHAHTVAQAALTQAHVVAAASLDHTQTVDTAALTQAHQLAAAGAEHTHTVSAGPLTQAHQIPPDEAQHTTGIAETQLMQAHQLTADATDHVQTAAAAALTQAHQLTADVADHTQTLDVPSLTQAGALTAAEAEHAHSVGAAALTQAHALTAAGTAHAHTAASTALTQAHTTAVDDLAHVQTLEQAAFVQAHILSAAGVTHVHTLSGPRNGTLYWAVYPAATAEPTAQQLSDQTAPGYFFSDDPVPFIANGQLTGTVITGLTPSTDYKLSVVWYDGVTYSNIEVTAFTTTSGGILVSPAALSQAQTLTSPALTQAHVISVANVTHITSVGATGLTQAHALQPAGANQLQFCRDAGTDAGLHIDARRCGARAPS